MRAYHSSASLLHTPVSFSRRGATVAHPEAVERYIVLHRALLEGGFDVRETEDHGVGPLRAVHAQEYLDFLSSAWERRVEIDTTLTELLPTLFARPQMHRRPTGLLALLGYYIADTATAIREGTWAAAYGTAQAAVSAADTALADGCAYALCRPPGHHAYADCAGGFCYINNTAVAAQRLRSQTAGRVAVLDLDVHHGNGTQGIFYERSDVLTISIHADPSNYYPCYAGYAEECGSSDGAGCNLNLPLPYETGDAAFLEALGMALQRIRQFAPAALVIALGLDAAQDDPLGAFKITREGFVAAAGAAAGLRVPTAIVQEGGYLSPALPANLTAFLRAFQDAAYAVR
ncbi:MAG TPA: histone deacetylase family protein [Steroidobacteraceae bacterium]|nr:histone deacetylase family protein [Steroidobacteraceae bacterium]